MNKWKEGRGIEPKAEKRKQVWKKKVEGGREKGGRKWAREGERGRP